MRSLEVVDAGPLSTVQDQGRVRWAHLGVPRAGALDQPAADLANRLVGNDPAAAVVETTAGGVVLRATSALTLAVTGAECRLRVAGREQPLATAVPVPAGALVEVGEARAGVRSYVAVAGGVDVARVLGSRSTDTLAWVGPPQLHPGDVLPVGEPAGPPSDASAAHLVRRPPEVAPLRVGPGPRPDVFGADALARLCASSYSVASDSNRVALRLAGEPLSRSGAEVATEGVVLGAVQVPPSGRPLVFLADHPTTGGYPVVAVVDPRDLWQCAQLRPGSRVRFVAG